MLFPVHHALFFLECSKIYPEAAVENHWGRGLRGSGEEVRKNVKLWPRIMGIKLSIKLKDIILET